ncbi:MAG: acetate kinase [Candidatus Hydrogenedentes bacterium]|nr:acetate kinase [Candidatus Hydrogenedentota bacterium]
MKILVLNSGSSSVKFKIYEVNGDDRELAHGMVERIGLQHADVKCGCCLVHDPKCAAKYFGEPGQLCIPDHNVAINMICDLLRSDRCGVIKDISEIAGIGHRVVHGGEEFSNTALIDDKVIEGIERCAKLAPLHNPPALLGIRACMEAFKNTPQAAVFDTAFHRSIPEKAFRYAIPEEFYLKHGIRKYGFHGTSHRYVSREAAKLLGKPIEETRIITCHLGNGSSITAVAGGKSIDTTMGLTPLAGVMMGTRPGDLDPYIPIFMIKELGMSAPEVDKILNKHSGFEGICHHHDVREIEALSKDGDKNCSLALEMFAYRASRFIGGSAMALNGVDAIVFTGGIGEHDADMRARMLANATHLGVKIDPERNAKHEKVITTDSSPTKVFVIPTNEELVIARDTAWIVKKLAEHNESKAVAAVAN